MALPEMNALALPSWIMVMAGMALLGVAFLLPKTGSRELVNDKDWGTERWFSHAEALLRGRYLFTRTQAADAVREARVHLDFDGGQQGQPALEFGNVEVFAAGLAASAEAGDSALRTVKLRSAGLIVAAAVIYALAVVAVVNNGNWWFGLYGIVVATWCLLSGVRLSRRKSGGKQAQLLQRRRRIDVEAMADDFTEEDFTQENHLD